MLDAERGHASSVCMKSGAATPARDVAVSASGLIHLACPDAHVIHTLSPDGTLRVLAGNIGQKGLVNGWARSALFQWPRCIAFDCHQNLLVGDHGCVRSIAPNGLVSTRVTLTTSILNYFPGSPGGIAVDSHNGCYVIDRCRLWHVTPENLVSVVFDTLPGVSNNSFAVEWKHAFVESVVLDELAGLAYVARSNGHLWKLRLALPATQKATMTKRGTSPGSTPTALAVWPVQIPVDWAHTTGLSGSPTCMVLGDDSWSLLVLDSGHLRRIEIVGVADLLPTLVFFFSEWPPGLVGVVLGYLIA